MRWLVQRRAALVQALPSRRVLDNSEVAGLPLFVLLHCMIQYLQRANHKCSSMLPSLVSSFHTHTQEPDIAVCRVCRSLHYAVHRSRKGSTARKSSEDPGLHQTAPNQRFTTRHTNARTDHTYRTGAQTLQQITAQRRRCARASEEHASSHTPVLPVLHFTSHHNATGAMHLEARANLTHLYTATSL